MLTENLKYHYTECIVAGKFPEQDFFTREEAHELVQIALVWACEQVRHSLEEEMEPTYDFITTTFSV